MHLLFWIFNEILNSVLAELPLEHIHSSQYLHDNENPDNQHFLAFGYTNLSFTHAESPVWDPDIQMLYWVDVLNQDVHALEYYTGNHKVKHISYGEVNVIVPVKNSSRLLIGVRSEVYLLDWNREGDAALRHIAVLDPTKPDNILNEGKADAYGRFWGGTKGPQNRDKVELDQAALYSMEKPCYQPHIHLKPVTLSNGLVWSLNNSVLFYIDSATSKIEAFDYNLDKGEISNRRLILDIKEYGYTKSCPDGMTIDRNGMLWVALMFDGSIIRINPDARYVIEKYKLPVSRTTSLTWAGRDLSDLIVTTSRRNMDEDELSREALSGAIFILHGMGTSGVPDHKVVFPNADTY
ncbi:hypothetical protein K1T71_012170 [Dendrolimus kikuchii]|uniref:Uncharacterized protein n=1 Tax=Dendrolimus kikuchii TaxID=765133 RepID=A0ACC1CL31_9NEOP|nr:hypothetical protein K1T71_012170 [Dendrolimus kikuchii]